MNLTIFIIVIAVSFIAVRIGAIAFQLTGLEWSVAKFQALSCFTSTGFTTKEAELITGSRQRRRIASILIVFGHAGLVTMIATLANSLRARVAIEDKLSKPLLPFLSIPPWLVQWVNLIIVIVAVYVIYRVFTNSKVARKLTDFLRKNIIKREIVKPTFLEELATITGGYGISQIEICKGSPVSGKTLTDSGLRGHDITVLAIIRGGKTIPNPSANTEMLERDELLCFGKSGNIKEKICTISSQPADNQTKEGYN